MKGLSSFMEDVMEFTMESDTYIDDEIADDIELEDELDEEDAFEDDIDELDIEDDIGEESTGLNAFLEDIMAETNDAVYTQILEDNTDYDDDF